MNSITPPRGLWVEGEGRWCCGVVGVVWYWRSVVGLHLGALTHEQKWYKFGASWVYLTQTGHKKLLVFVSFFGPYTHFRWREHDSVVMSVFWNQKIVEDCHFCVNFMLFLQKMSIFNCFSFSNRWHRKWEVGVISGQKLRKKFPQSRKFPDEIPKQSKKFQKIFSCSRGGGSSQKFFVKVLGLGNAIWECTLLDSLPFSTMYHSKVMCHVKI